KSASHRQSSGLAARLAGCQKIRSSGTLGYSHARFAGAMMWEPPFGRHLNFSYKRSWSFLVLLGYPLPRDEIAQRGHTSQTAASAPRRTQASLNGPDRAGAACFVRSERWEIVCAGRLPAAPEHGTGGVCHGHLSLVVGAGVGLVDPLQWPKAQRG